ncbi:MAG: efflux transporter periplasmic adaptor subunit [Crocinitomicaceae bacterium]|jgi:Cu(I)/Ag(I) efflux system membrane fusion protein|uniref:Efflux RND transporter periplasmic adaptor subunit n=1 Tax=Algoriphagus sediminis TaxID=3057113 RepID=A0ABT7YHF6_9BACT|nr:efflux RND transporter periplasmic adaptor subunit [Algoriphagus sediminis]MAX79803.1 efflux transporter periplasmic adaptor subunit [Crocinitomicaceae bacterium]MDN3205958.1 efflux RND transporter periplasmic adaptor subunit [Algoriphagus sediminis]|tara:strand:+ start:788 stop:2566 length:1779 start_codon:yes stop_codon:yes gene_type:complete
MKNINKTTVIIAISTMAIGLLLGWIIFGRSNENQTDEHNHTAMADSETIWTCSMHPQIRKSESGDCPICGMDLIPLESTDGELDPMAVSMSPTAMQLAQIQTMVVNKGKADKSIRLNGKVQADERLLSTQSSHIPGRIEKLSVNFTGEFVSAGQVLANVYSPELVTAQEELFEAKKIKETQPALFNAAKEKLKNWKLSDKQIDQIVKSNKTIEQFPILANVSGYVTKKMVNLGDYIKQGEALYEIADLSKVWVLFDVYETDMTWINKGDAVIYTVQSIPGKTFKGKISYIDPVIDPKTRVAKARLEATNKGLMLKPEMFTTGTIEAKTNTNYTSLTVPKTAVMWTGKRSVVYVMQMSAQGISFIMREVTLGPELGESYVIEDGLQPGEEIAINGTFSIDAAAQLAGKPSMMNPEGGVAMTGHNHGGNTNSNMEKMPVSSKKTTISEDAKKSLQPLFDNYFKLKIALASDDFEKAKASGVAMNNSLGKIDMNLFKGDAHSLWMQQSTALKPSLQHIEHLGDIKAIRGKFISISNLMIAIAESFAPLSTAIYIQNCPMADSNKGADWLSLDKEIQNPYFGESMLSCGENTKTIK